MPLSSLNSTQASIVSNSVNGGAILMLLICIAGLAGLFLLISSLERYTKFFDTLYKILYTIKYTAVGACVVIIGYGMYVACFAIASVGGGVDPAIVAGGIGAYIGITVIGYAAVKVLERIKSMHASYVASKVVV